ncbi:ABC transporter ATP-binding protein [Nakamurella silvestris]|nr:ABC transporter ATP-binding protein [Nakamurella silvestris]
MDLQLSDVSVAYGTTTAVDRVSLRVRPGQVLALLGPSGCGKSTLLRAVAGLEPLRGGRITFGEQDLAGVPVHRRGFGLMFQDGVLFPHRTVAGNIAYGLTADRATRAAWRRVDGGVSARVEELLELVGLSGYTDRKVASLSGGEQQRVALARALAPAPRLLLLDEPLAALDAGLRDRLLMDLRGILAATGTTAVFVTHDQAEAFAVADTVAVMEAGQVRQHGPLREVWDHPVSEWVARFIGYSSVIDDPAGGRLALRPSALRLDPRGEISGIVTGVSPRPESLLITVTVDGWGVVSAVGPSEAGAAVGDRVRLRLDRSHAVVLAG